MHNNLFLGEHNEIQQLYVHSELSRREIDSTESVSRFDPGSPFGNEERVTDGSECWLLEYDEPATFMIRAELSGRVEGN